MKAWEPMSGIERKALLARIADLERELAKERELKEIAQRDRANWARELREARERILYLNDSLHIGCEAERDRYREAKDKYADLVESLQTENANQQARIASLEMQVAGSQGMVTDLERELREERNINEAMYGEKRDRYREALEDHHVAGYKCRLDKCQLLEPWKRRALEEK